MEAFSLERLLKYQLKLVDLSIDIDRNMLDAEQRNAIRASEAIYVFDANIFELFIDPLDERGAQTSLHSSAWLETCGIYDPNETTSLSAIAPQTCLLTIEYLFSKAFSKSSDNHIYMTEWHFYEYGRRLTDLTRKLWKQAKASEQKDPKIRFERIRQAKAFLDNPKADLMADLATIDPLLSKDVQDCLSKRLLDAEELNPFVANRLLLNILCEDNDLEQIDQINRLLEKGISNRIRLLPRKYHPRGEREIFERECIAWNTRLKRERSREGRRPRSPEALLDDAKSLAHVAWAAQQAEDYDEQVVFITADDLIFDAYRRWYTDLKADDANRPPFVVRRLSQYTPLYNMADSSNALGGNVKGLFHRIRMLLKTTLAPIMLAVDRGLGKAKAIAPSQRKMAAPLYLKEPTPISKVTAFEALVEIMQFVDRARNGDALNKIMEELRLIERTTLGLADEYVRARLFEWERALPEINQPHPEVYEKAFRSYIQEKIQTAIDSSLKFSLPLALRFIKEWRLERRTERPRAPIFFLLKLAGATETDLADILNQALAEGRHNLPISDRQWEVIGNDPAATFFMAGWLCLVSEKWAEAEQYADLCLMWAKAASMPTTTIETAEQAEYYFLCAVTKRFRIGATGPSSRLETQASIATQFDQASQLLHSCIEFHAKFPGDMEERLRGLRARSELAALNLFYAATLMPKVRYALDTYKVDADDDRRQLDLARATLDGAVGSLDECFSQLRDFPSVGGETVASQEVFNRIRLQIGVNYAASFCLRGLADLASGAYADGNADIARKIVEGILEDFLRPGAPASAPLLSQELLLFAAMHDLNSSARKFEMPSDMDGLRFSLRLDKALYQALREVYSKLPTALG